ncbi:MAG: hypothetical protein P1V97_02405 [Planctomycetota bacterium]|nr:hypothetical protein [Planctomycetota bacterium]
MYLLRFAGLLSVAAIVAFIDWRRNGVKATRPREYGFVFVCGLLGAIFGILWDQGTVTLSPDYFIYGKGLNPEDGPLRVLALALGFKAGFFGGLVVGMTYLIANSSGRNRTVKLPYPVLLRGAVWPLLALIPLAVLGFFVFETWDPLGKAPELRRMLSKDQTQNFLRVWGLHAGLYLGAVLGLIFGVIRIRKALNLAISLHEEEENGQNCADAEP